MLYPNSSIRTSLNLVTALFSTVLSSGLSIALDVVEFRPQTYLTVSIN